MGAGRRKVERGKMAESNKAFWLTYAHQVAPDSTRLNYEFRERRVVLYRVAGNWAIPEDNFHCCDAATDEFLGEGDTKEDAIGEARYRLMKQSEAAFEAAAEGAALAVA
jgi:hypothetical protein